MTDRRKQALDILVDNAQRVSEEHREEVIKWSGIVRGKVNGKVAFLPGYVPYVGKSYFDAKKKILVYAMSQNLSDNSKLAGKWATEWTQGDKSLALNRQNIWYDDSAPDAPRAVMHPFDTGHVPILCGLLHSLLTNNAPPSRNIYDSIAATNLSKFSFRNGTRTCDSSFSFKQCWKWFSEPEIRELEPDAILCLGDQVYKVVKNAAETLPTPSCPRVFKAAFPNHWAFNKRFKTEQDHLPLRPLSHIQLAQRAASDTIIVKAPRWSRAQRHIGNPG